MDLFVEHLSLFIVFATAFQAAIFMVLFFGSRKGSPEIILGYYELAYLFTYSFIFIFLLEEYRIFIPSYYLLIPCYALFPVLFFLFIRKISRRKLLKRDFFHFAFPLLLFLVNLTLLTNLNYREKYAIIVENNLIHEADISQKVFYRLHLFTYPLLIKIQVFVYIILSWFEILSLNRKIKQEYSYLKGINLRWATRFLVIFTIMFILSLIIYNEDYYFTFILLVNLIIGFAGVHYRYVHYELKNQLNQPGQTEGKLCGKYAYSLISEEEKDRIYESLQEYIEVGKKYVNPDLRLSDIAKDIHTNRQYLSQVINERSGENFYHFINKFRIREFIDQLENDASRNISIEGMACNAGFKSKTSFYSTFKRVKGCTPKTFMKKKRKNYFNREQ